MKKAMLLVIMLIMVLGFNSILWANPSNAPLANVLSTVGQFTKVREGEIQVTGTGYYTEVILKVTPDTSIIDAFTGELLDTSALQEGAYVTAYYSPVLTKSIPPQGKATALLIGRQDQSPDMPRMGFYHEVGKIWPQHNGDIRILNTNSDILINIPAAVFPELKAIKAGSELVTWYDAVALSMPGQTTANKIILLPAKVTVHPNAGVITVNKQELTLSSDDKITTAAGIVMVPLRIVAENAGYTVVWDATRNQAEIKFGRATMALVDIGDMTYQKGASKVKLEAAPALVSGKTLVPVEFFSKILGLKVTVNNSEV